MVRAVPPVGRAPKPDPPNAKRQTKVVGAGSRGGCIPLVCVPVPNALVPVLAAGVPKAPVPGFWLAAPPKPKPVFCVF